MNTWEGSGDPMWGWDWKGRRRTPAWGFRGQACEGHRTPSSHTDCSCQSSGFLRPGARVRKLPGAGLPGCGVQGIQQECMDFPGLLQHGKRACSLGLAGVHVRAHTSVLCVCARACVHMHVWYVHVCAHAISTRRILAL